MHHPKGVHWTTTLRILAYIKSSPEKTLLYKNREMYAFLRTLILVMLVTKEISLLQGIAPLLAETLRLERARNKMWYLNLLQRLYTELWLILSEMWLKNLMIELDFRHHGPMPMHCDNQSAIYICP